jgi:hypothetical protein
MSGCRTLVLVINRKVQPVACENHIATARIVSNRFAYNRLREEVREG